MHNVITYPVSFSFMILRRHTTATKKLQLIECRKTTVHFLKQGNELLLFLLVETGHKCLNTFEACKQHMNKQIERLAGNFDGHHATIFGVIVALDQT